jgi:hypothetical protein
VPALLLLLPVGGCGASGPSPDAIAALGDEEIAYTELAGFVETQTDSSPAALEAAVLSSLLDQYLDERILVRLAVDRGVMAPGEEPSALDPRSALTALLGDDPVPQPTEEELRTRYEERRRAYELPARVRLRQILVEDRETAEDAAAELTAGADFSEVARRYSVDPSASTGGVQGELSRADLPEEFAEIIFGLEPGETSDVVEADYGFHIFLVTERLPERTLPFEEASATLRARLWEERADARLAQLVADARNRYTVRVYEQNLPFDYRGTYPTAPTAGGSEDGPAE